MNLQQGFVCKNSSLQNGETEITEAYKQSLQP